MSRLKIECSDADSAKKELNRKVGDLQMKLQELEEGMLFLLYFRVSFLFSYLKLLAKKLAHLWYVCKLYYWEISYNHHYFA